MRDRTHPGTIDDPDFTALMESLRRNGQRTPIEVVDMGKGRYGLISGWRRLTALRRLRDETGEDQFANVLAFLRQPKSAEDAYVAMVEENEIRLALSFYERARITAKSVEAGAFSTPKAALQTLFASASRAKRSKIGSFLGLYQVLGDDICFPQALTERLGLALSKVLEADEAAGQRLMNHLKSARPQSPEAEQSLLSEFVEAANNARVQTQPRPVPHSEKTSAPEASNGRTPPQVLQEVCPGVFLSQRAGNLLISGPAVDSAFYARLKAWLKNESED
jgi:ParB-like chromosome segregation protein Spo0J